MLSYCLEGKGIEMLGWMREKFGPVMIGIIIGFIAFVFVFYGVFSPKATRGLHSGSVAGTVNGEPITLTEFSKELNRRVEFMKNLSGGKLSEAQMKAFRIREMVFNELVNKKLMRQAALESGLVASDEEVREKSRQIDAFHKDGRFDADTYMRVLEMNNYSPSGFEQMIREDVALQQVSKQFKRRVRVSDEEVRREFLLSQDKRNIKYVLLTPTAAKKVIKIDSGAVVKFLADSAKLNLVRTHYEQKKDREFKGLNFEIAKEQIARDLLAGEKSEEIKKINESLAGKILGIISASKGSDKQVNAVLKPYGVEVKQTGLITRQSPFLPGIGEAKELLTDAFATKSPIDGTAGGKAKKYTSVAWTLVAVVTEKETPDLSKMEASREQLMNQIAFKKERVLYENWMKGLSAKAKIEKNDAVLSDGDDQETPSSEG